jgi:3-hydroxyisobutyrate dehydrogenase-like beta-hydroxyacid dehydrogenase
MKACYCLKQSGYIYIMCAAITSTMILSSCAGLPPPTEQMAVSEAAISNAASAGSNEFAPLPLKSSRDKFENAERAMAAKDYLLARRLAEQAQVDAQLAAATSRSVKAQKAAAALQEDNRVLRKEIDRNAQ